MSFSKPTKPEWATGNSNYSSEPSLGKKLTGWLSLEKPPYQWMNWLFLKIYQWLNLNEFRQDFSDTITFNADAAITWSGSVIVVPANGMRLGWRSGNNFYTNTLPAGNYTLADGECLVFIPSFSNIALASVSYASLAEGKFAIVATSAFANNTSSAEVILFKRNGGILEAPIFKSSVQAGGGFALDDLRTHNHSDIDDGGTIDHGVLTGLGDDDHTQYTKADGSRAFTNPVAGVTPTLNAHLATKQYVDSIAIDDTHLCKDNTPEVISSSWTFSGFIFLNPGNTLTTDIPFLHSANSAFWKHQFIQGCGNVLVKSFDVLDENNLPLSGIPNIGQSIEFCANFPIIEDGGGTRDFEIIDLVDAVSGDKALKIDWMFLVDDRTNGVGKASAIGTYFWTQHAISIDIPDSALSNAGGNWKLVLRDDGMLVCRYDMVGTDRTNRASVRLTISRAGINTM